MRLGFKEFEHFRRLSAVEVRTGLDRRRSLLLGLLFVMEFDHKSIIEMNWDFNGEGHLDMVIHFGFL
jgi:hypothetical protein